VANPAMSGNSVLEAGQYVPMKSSQTGLPRSFERSIVPPPSFATTSGGAGWPRWNWAASGSLDDGEGISADDGVADTAADGDVVDAATVGALDALGGARLGDALGGARLGERGAG